VIVIIIDSMERCYFISRLVHEIRSEYELLFVTSEPLAYLRMCALGYRSIYLHRQLLRTRHNGVAVVSARVELAIEVLNGDIAFADAVIDAHAVSRILKNVVDSARVSRCVVWNGQQLLGRIVADLCRKANVPITYLEISNLPGKLFVDSNGVNALSTISGDPQLIDSLPMPEPSIHEAWLAQYESYKSKPLPQARTRPVRKLASLCNYAMKSATHGVAQKTVRLSRLRNGAASAGLGNTLPAAELMNKPYVFLPLQVSSDTQIKLHSSVDNFGAIRLAAEMAREQGLGLLVKIHPAEADSDAVRRVLDLRRELDFDVVSLPTVQLIKHAALIVTINSTVGLEALMYGKPVKALGRAFYERFDQTRLLKYIHSFLVDGVDYFGSEPIPAAAARKVFG
jgi:Capsule polysaccharide export protein